MVRRHWALFCVDASLPFRREEFDKVFGTKNPPPLLVVDGNHEWQGDWDYLKKLYTDPVMFRENVLTEDFPRLFEKGWGVKYEPFWHKEVNGYHFFGRGWGVDDDMVVFERHEVGEGGKLGPDWVMPLGKFNPHPFSKEEQIKAIGEPQFRKRAKLVVSTGSTRIRPHLNKKVSQEAIRLKYTLFLLFAIHRRKIALMDLLILINRVDEFTAKRRYIQN